MRLSHKPARRDPRQAAASELDAGCGEAANVGSLPRGLDGTRVVVPSNPGSRILGAYTAQLSDAGKCGPRAAYAARAGDFDAPAFNGEAMRLTECRPCFLGARRQPEVTPPKPQTRPRRLSGSPAEEVEPPLRVGLWYRTLAEAATAKTRPVGQLHNAWSKLPRHRLMVSGPVSQTAKVALADHGAAESRDGFVRLGAAFPADTPAKEAYSSALTGRMALSSSSEVRPWPRTFSRAIAINRCSCRRTCATGSQTTTSPGS